VRKAALDDAKARLGGAEMQRLVALAIGAVMIGFAISQAIAT